ncbi:MAG: ABC transporter ATP-binding protein [Thermoplasmatota archaeon]
MAEPALLTRNIRKTFDPPRRTLRETLRRAPSLPPKVALDGVNLEVRQGELFGLLGPNGAGKTTLVKILATLLLPTSGEAYVDGFDVRTDSDAIRQKLGVVLGGERALYWRLTGRENLWYFAQLYNIPSNVAKAKAANVLEIVGLSDRADDRVENYSKGMKQRLHIARGLLTDPQILLLDEPTIGLDPHAARTLRELIRALVREQGRTVVLTTHYMYEADELSDRIAILHRGKVVALGTPQDLKRDYGSSGMIRLRVRGGGPRVGPDVAAKFGLTLIPNDHDPTEAESDSEPGSAAAPKASPSLSPPGSPSAGEDEHEWRFSLPAALSGNAAKALPADIAASLPSLGARLVGVDEEPVTLEDVFVDLTGEDLTSEGLERRRGRRRGR